MDELYMEQYLKRFFGKVSQISTHVKKMYKAKRFNVTDTWPPVLPNVFIPLVLQYYKDKDTKEDITDDESLYNHTDVVLESRRAQVHQHYNTLQLGLEDHAITFNHTTTKISEILNPLEFSDDPQTILIEGAPGMGKTILLKHIACSWAEQVVLQKYELVLLICLRDPNVQKISSLKELFQNFCKGFADDDVDICIKHISSNYGKTLVFLMDGYDELPTKIRGKSFIANILNRQVLPDCGLVVTSRPNATAFVRKQISLHAHIFGFTSKEQKQFIENSLNDQSEIKQLTTYLNDHLIISSLCCVPFYISLLLFLFKMRVTLPNNDANLFENFICLSICQNLSKHGITDKQVFMNINTLPEPYRQFMHQLSKFSLLMLTNNQQLIFTLHEIKKYCPEVESIPGALNGFGLLQAIEDIDIFQPSTTLCFIHLSFQEFLAAYHITTLTEEEELLIFEKYFWDDVHYNMFTIYIALTKGQRSSFKRFLCGGNNTVAIDNKFFVNRLRMIQLYQYFYEERGANDHVCRTIEEQFCDGVIQFDNPSLLLSTNSVMENIACFITCCSIGQWKMIDLHDCLIGDFGLSILCHKIKNSFITIEELILYCNVLSCSSDSYLADILIHCHVKVLNIDFNSDIGQSKEFFSRILTSPLSVLEGLSMMYVNLSSEKAVILFRLLERNKKLKQLDISCNAITDDACNTIAETLRVNNTLNYLNISFNDITIQGAKSILNSLRNNNVLSRLMLPVFFGYQREQILELTAIVNEERRRHGHETELDVEFACDCFGGRCIVL